MASLPLRYRLPNPPAHFVGREAEAAWLAEAVQRAPVAVVCAPGGLGKTALVCQVLHRKHARQIGRVIFLRLDPDLADAELRQEILRALASAAGISAVDWNGLQGDSDALTTALLDLAEAGPWWVVLDDLHHAQPAEVSELLPQLARYARRSRWIGTSRMDPRSGDQAVQLLTLKAMSDADLSRLAQSWGDVTDLGRALQASGGSPWLLQQCCATGRTDARFTRESLLAGLSAGVIELVEALAALDVAVAEDALASFTAVPRRDELEMLERRGLVEETPGGLRLHDVVRNVLSAERTRRPIEARAGRALAQLADPVVALEGARLTAAAGDVDQLSRFLDARAEGLLADGYAQRLWRILEPLVDPRIAAWRLRCAAQLGNPTALAKVREPTDPAPRDRLAWAGTLVMQGDVDAGLEVALALAGSAVDDRSRLEASLLVARCRLAQADPAGAIAALRQASRADERARTDAILASCLASAGEAEAGVRASAARSSIDLVRPEEREEAAFDVATALYWTGHLASARDALGAAPSELALFTARRALWLRAAIDVDAGALEEAAGRLAALEPFLRSASILRPSVLATVAALRLARGQLTGLAGALSDAEDEARRFGATECALYVRSLRVELATLEAVGVPREPDGRVVATRGRELLRLRGLHQDLRWSQTIGPEAIDAIDTARPFDLDLRPLVRVIRAGSAFRAGRVDEALAESRAAVRDASESGHLLGELEALSAACEIAVLAGRRDEVAAAAERLEQRADAIGAGRFRLQAVFYRLAARPSVDWAILEDLAAREDGDPVAARRARLLLGDEAPADWFDQLVIERLRAAWRVDPPALVGDRGPPAGSWEPGWGLSDARLVWLPSGRTVDFSRRPRHWRVLEVLAERGGRASKEDLVLAVWEEREYHPLKHDPRLQMAVRKVRELIEDDPARPARVVTTEDGYALAGRARRIRPPP